MSNCRITIAVDAGFGSVRTSTILFEKAQEQVASLAADVCRRAHHLPGQLALHGYRVLVDPLGNRVLVGIGPRLVRAVVRIVDEVRAQQGGIDRKRAAADCRADAVALDRLNLIIGLARTDVEAEAAAHDRPPRLAGRPRERHARLDVVLLRRVERRAGRLDGAVVDIEQHGEIARLRRGV
jgi:hypothetical protein